MFGFDTKSLLMGFGIGVIVVSLIGICIFTFQQNLFSGDNDPKSAIVSLESKDANTKENNVAKKVNEDPAQSHKTLLKDEDGKSGLIKLTDDSVIYN